jgi:hypothetical protein
MFIDALDNNLNGGHDYQLGQACFADHSAE